MVFVRDSLAGKIPITVITGFLGSGKTTLISQLVRHPDMRRVALVINEVGEIGIDHDLVTMSSENISLLANGCICCSVRTDMQETLRDLFAKRRVGEIFDFDRVIIETTGLADPAPVLQTLVSDSLLEAQFRLDGVATLVDAVNAYQLLKEIPEAVKQVAIADQLFLTKTDLATPEMIHQITTELQALNPQAPIEQVLNGNLEPQKLMNIGLGSSKVNSSSQSFLSGLDTFNEGEADKHQEKYLGEFRRHSGINTLSLRFDEPFTWKAFSSALELLTGLRGNDLLRVKGIVNVEGDPVVIQGVQHIFHPQVKLDRWPSQDHTSRIVFITRNMSKEMIMNLFKAVGAIA